MKKRVSLFLALMVVLTTVILSATPVFAAPRLNNYPIVLVHGLGGFGRDEALGIRYWGMLFDIQEYLKSQGYNTYTVGVGPVSSNWDRACETYAQIKGGTVDYGAAHAAAHRHARYGRTYPGYYPEWGNVDEATGKIKKVHLIGHSMGGQTIRTLVQLLEQGSPADTAASPDASPLFTGGKSWVSGCMSISTPHDGTSLDNAINKGVPWLQDFIGSMAALFGPNNLYDLKLDQWGLVRSPGESVDSYLNRVWSSSFWQSKDDMSNVDLTVEGARALNGWVKAQPDVYYFSWATSTTFREIFTGRQIPMLSTNVMLMATAGHIGAYTRNNPGEIPITSEWWRNDGLVPVICQDGPSINSTDTIVSFNGSPRIGAWNYMGLKDGYDHLDIIGMGTLWDPRGWYLQQAQLLGSLNN
ncbi:MAG: lipase family alpha/beta hydrolase [Candidatus Saccharibacteria bacterium]